MEIKSKFEGKKVVLFNLNKNLNKKFKQKYIYVVGWNSSFYKKLRAIKMCAGTHICYHLNAAHKNLLGVLLKAPPFEF
jgi:hypothetical protein